MSFSNRKVISIGAAVAACLAAAAASAAPASYVLQSKGRWTLGATAAVEAAGGMVRYSHGDTGIAVVVSDNANFLSAARATGAFSQATADQAVQWQKPVQTFDFAELGVDPNPPTDAFYPYIQWAPQSVNAPEAWAAGCTGSGVRVAILDGGIYDAHPDLVGQIDVSASRSFVPGQPWNADTGTFWHGTHVAGIVAAKANNPAPGPGVAIGTVGIAPEATLIGVKVLHAGSGDFGWLIEGVLYASTPIDQGGAGADIINMSLGADFPKNEEGAGPLVAALNKALNYAASRGVLTVSSAGNDGYDLDHTGNLVTVPAQSGSGIAVSATGPVGFAYGATDFARPASYTNYGTSVVNVAAPGGDFAYPTNEACSLPRASGTLVTVPCYAFDMVLSTSRAGWSWAAGTSMAAPAASAVAAIIKQSHPGISLGALKTMLANSSTDEGKKGRDPFYGAGYVNAYKACTAK